MANRRGRRQFGWVRKLPSGRFQASYLAADGGRRYAPETFKTRGDAAAWLTLRESEMLRGEWIDPELGRITLATFGSRWIEEHKLSERTRELYEMLLRLHISPFLGGRQLARISPDTVRTWRNQLLNDGRSADAAAKSYRLLRAIMNTALDDGRIRRNPCRIKGADKAHTPERPVATIAQVYTLAELIGDRFRVFILAAAFTGLRWGELLALRRMDVNLDAGTIGVTRSVAELSRGRLVVGPPKSAAGVRTVTIPGVLVDELRRHLAEFVGTEPWALVFTGSRGASPRRSSWRQTVQWSARIKEAGLPEGFHFHDLRHTGNHLASQGGASTRELMHRMGHASMRAALIYQHATDERARQIADRLSEVVEREKPRDDDSDGEAGAVDTGG
jgi:integrase